MAAPSSATLALVESPAQLLNVVEWATSAGERAELDADDLHVVVLAPTDELSRRQLRAMSRLAREEGLRVSWHEPRQGGAATARTVRSLAAQLAGIQRLVVGDPVLRGPAGGDEHQPGPRGGDRRRRHRDAGVRAPVGGR